MQPIKTRGIVLRAQNMGEADKMLTVLSASSERSAYRQKE